MGEMFGFRHVVTGFLVIIWTEVILMGLWCSRQAAKPLAQQVIDQLT